jgi:hypothetical protein
MGIYPLKNQTSIEKSLGFLIAGLQTGFNDK